MGFRINRGVWQFLKADGTYESKFKINTSGTLVTTDASGNEVNDVSTEIKWSSISGKPTQLSQFTNNLGNYGGWLTTSGKAADSDKLDGIDSTGFAASSHTHTFASLTSKPTTLSGFGITDAATSAQGTKADTAHGWGNHGSAGYATTSYVTTQINNLIASAPGTLDTLNELAAALGDDPNFATTITTALAGKASTSHTHTFASITSKPTTLSGYGITDAASSSHTHDDRYYTESEVNSLLSGKQGTGNYTTFVNDAYLTSSGDTAAFLTELYNNFNAFRNNHVVLKMAWSYAGNSDLNTGTHGTIELAGCIIECWGNTATRHVRITRPNTGTGNAAEMLVYNDQGSGYSPGWTRIWNDKNINPIISATVSNDTTTFTKADGSTFSLTTSDANTDTYVTGASFASGTGVLTLTRNSGSVTVNLDGRYLTGLPGHTHDWSEITGQPTSLSQFTNDLGNYGGWLSASGKAADSNLLDGLDLHTGRNNEVNKVVRTNANGYIDAGWINTTSGNTTSTLSDIYVNTNDGYIRKATPAHFRSQITDGYYASPTQGSQGATAYGWGNHASAGYLTSINNSNWSGTVLSIANGGTGSSLTDPNADRIMFWDDSAGTVTWLAPGSNLSISGTTINATNTTYSVGNGGLTEINFTSALNSKLSGIETGATADQSASEILTLLKTVDGTGSGLDADLLDGQNSSYFQAASSAITTSNIGSQSVNYANSAGSASSAGTSTHTYRGIVEDSRAAQRTPNDYDDYRASFEFTNQVVSDWHSIFTMKGWTDGYYAWQLIGPAATSNDENLYFRTGVNGSWGSIRTVWHNGNINPIVSATVSNDTTTYVRADGTSFALTTSDANTNKYLSGASFNTTDGVLTLTVASGSTVTVDLDGRYATPSDITNAINGLIDGAPAALNTLNELAAAIGDNESYASSITTALSGKANTSHTHAISDVTGLQTALDGKQAAGSYAAANHNHTYDVNDSWLREAGDNNNFRIYGNSRMVIFRTDGTGGGEGHTGYPFNWRYGGDATGNTLMLLNTDGTIWTKTYGWLHTYFAAASHNHDDRYYTETEVNNLLAGKQASGSYAAASHSHAISDVTGLQGALDGKQAAGSYAASSHTHSPSQVGLGNVSNAAQVTTTYNSSLNSDSRNSRGVTRLYRNDSDSDYNVQTNWTGSYWYLKGYSGDTYHAGVQVAYSDLSGSVAWGNVSGKPSTFSPSSHTHAISDITNLQSTLDGKAAASHTHNYDNYGSWTISDGTRSEAIGSGATLQVRGTGATTATYDAATNILTINSTDTNTDTNTTYSAGSGIGLSGTTFSVAAGGGLTQTSTGLAHADTSSQASVNNSGRTYIQDITLDTYGHITGITSATETVTNTDTVTRVGISGSEATGTVTFVGSGATTVTQSGSTVTITSTDTNTDTNTWRAIHDTPVNGATTTSISSNWAYDHAAVAITTSNIGSQSVSYANTAGRAYPYRSDGNPLDFYWSGQGGQPSWLWGGNDGRNMYVYNPSNFSVNYANGAGTSNQLTGGVGSWGGNTDFNSIRIQNRTIFREMLGTNRTAPNWPATPLQRASGSGAYNYGSVLSASGDYAHFEIYIPNNTSNIVHPEFVPYLRTGYQGGWSNWSRFVMSVDDTTTLTGSDGVALVVDSQVTYGQRSSAIVEMNGQSDNWASSSYRLNTKSEDNLGCEWLFEKFTVDEGWRTLGFVNRNNDDNLMWMGDILWNASDERLKTNISTMTGALESVKQIRPVTYEWDPEMQEHHRREGSDIGFIAQELEEILPEVVVTRPDGYKVIKYEKVVPLLLGAIKDQQALIESLMSRVEALENK